MTSILGIKCEKGLEGVVVISDFSGLQTKLVNDGPDTAHYERRRIKSKKLHVDSKREVVIGNTGQTNLYRYSQFLSAILKDSSSIKRAIEKTHRLKELEQLNTQISQSSLEPNPLLIKMLIATRYKNIPRLFQSNENGYIEEVPTVFLGSGSGLMFEYMSRNRKVIPSETSIPEGIELGLRCLQEAYRDPFTNGIDLVVLTPKKIDELGEGIRDAVRYARKNAIKDVIKKYKHK